MNDTHQKLLRAFVAAQAAVVEHADSDCNDHSAIDAALARLDAAIKDATKLAKKLRKDD